MKRAGMVIVFLLLTSCSTGQPAQDLFAEAQNARATADAAQDLASYQERFLTATAEAPIVHITETAAAQSVRSTATADAMALEQRNWTVTAQSVQETQTAAMTATAMAWTPTMNATQTAVFAVLHAQGTQVANEAVRDTLELDRQKYNNDFFANLPGLSWALVALFAILGAMLFVRRERYKPAQVDARGNVLPMIDTIEGTVTDVDRSPNYLSGMRRADLPALPPVTAERQDAATQRDQLVDLAVRGLPDAKRDERKRLAGQEIAKQLAVPNLQGRFKVLEDGTHDLEVIDGEIIQVLDNEWKETDKG